MFGPLLFPHKNLYVEFILPPDGSMQEREAGIKQKIYNHLEFFYVKVAWSRIGNWLICK